MKKNKATSKSISIEEANTASREARKRARRKRLIAEGSNTKNEKVFNRWLKETHPESYKKIS
jgi:hypothetical protein